MFVSSSNNGYTGSSILRPYLEVFQGHIHHILDYGYYCTINPKNTNTFDRTLTVCSFSFSNPTPNFSYCSFDAHEKGGVNFNMRLCDSHIETGNAICLRRGCNCYLYAQQTQVALSSTIRLGCRSFEWQVVNSIWTLPLSVCRLIRDGE